MTRDEKLNNIIEAYNTSELSLYDALDIAYIAGKLKMATKYQIDIDNQIGEVNKVLETIQELKNGK